MEYMELKGFSIKVSREGYVISTITNKPLKAVEDRGGYFRIYTKNANGKRCGVSVHRAVALTYLPNIHNKSDVNHKDGNKGNNHIDNLEWVTKSENMKHSVDTGLRRETILRKRKSSRNKLVKELLKIGYKREFLAEAFGVSETIITRISKYRH